jgi:hypothetical protein
MATQVVVFSVLLFGTSGVVLDFGRVFSEHSQMQSFTDQAALSAASEMDRKPDSIDDAVASVFGSGSGAPITKNAAFSDGIGNQFNISHLFFLRDLSDDDGAQYSMGADLTGDNLLYTAFADGSSAGSKQQASLHARYVIAVAEERSVRNGLMRLINSTGSDTVPEANVVRTIAAAKRQELTCGSISNLVMCNPWEGQDTINYEVVAADDTYAGLQFSLIADGQIDQDGILPLPNSLARRLELEGTAAVKQVCNDPLQLPGYDVSNSAAQNAAARTICMLAAAVQGDFCESADELRFVPAEPEFVTTSLNTAFDMWDYPISEVLKWDLDADGDHSQLVDNAGVSQWGGASHPMRDSSVLFQPDLDIFKGRLWHEPTAILNEANGIPRSSRLNFRRAANYDNYRLSLLACLRNPGGIGADVDCYRDEDGNVINYMGDPSLATYGSAPSFFSSYYRAIYNEPYLYEGIDRAATLHTYYDLYLSQREDFLHTENGINPPGHLFFLPPIPPGSATVSFFHSAGTGLTLTQADQRTVREDGSLSSFVGGTPQIQRIPDYDDVTGAPLAKPAPNATRQQTTRSYPQYTYTDPATGDVDHSTNRRVMDVTLINCGEATVNDAGENVAPIAGYAQMILMNPPEVECPDGSEACLNSQLSSAQILTEFVQESNLQKTNFAVLVK